MGLIAAFAASAALCVPASALAAPGTYGWNLAPEFTSAAPGANPDHGPAAYGGTPWTYGIGTTSFTNLDTFSASEPGSLGGLAGWTESTDASAFVGINPSGSNVTDTPFTFDAHGIVMQPGGGQSVAVGWTSPFATSTTVTVVFSVSAAAGGLSCLGGTPGWNLEQNGQTIAGDSGTAPSGSKIAFPTIPAGGTIYLVVSPPGALSTDCAATNVALAVAANGSAPAVTLTTPTSGTTFTGGQSATFSGTAGNDFGDSSQVTVKVYRGSSATGSPVQTLSATRSGTGYSVPDPSELADGTYAAVASQGDEATPSDVGQSSPVTFMVQNGGPTVTLNSLGSAPLKTATPVISGTAGTASGDSEVSVVISPADNPNQVVRFHTATVAANGDFSLEVMPALPDGQYTVSAFQVAAAGGLGESAPVTFSLKLHAPAVTLTSPAAGTSVAQQGATFSGGAETGFGDSNTVTVALWKGNAAKGKPLGTERTTVSGTTWSVTWAHQLPLGLYTVQASQTDDVGHTGRTSANTFLIVPAPTTIGSTVDLDRSGVASVPITCFAKAGTNCTGDVLVLTSHGFQPTRGGPTGPIRVLFAFVTIPGGHTVVVRRNLRGSLTRFLLHKLPLQVRVSTSLREGAARAITNTATRTLRES
jgi:hypothetical protein